MDVLQSDGSSLARIAIQRAGKSSLVVPPLIFLILLIITIASVAASQSIGMTAALGIGSLIFLASASVGGVFGFLFAIPRILTQSGQSVVSSNSSTGAISSAEVSGSDANKAKLRAKAQLLGSNTNLERISDWLTTMLVGVGLSQIGNLGIALKGFQEFLSSNAKIFPGTTGAEAATAGALPVVGPMLLILGVGSGFLCMYLFTRLDLNLRFNKVEEELVGVGHREYLNDPKTKSAVLAATRLIPNSDDNLEYKDLVSGKKPSVEGSLYIMLQLLYEPEKYDEVLKLGDALSKTSATSKALYWIYMASAYGQKYSAALAKKEPRQKLSSLRGSVLYCVERALSIDSEYEDMIWELSDKSSTDNDLKDFRMDSQFRKLVGRPIKQK